MKNHFEKALASLLAAALCAVPLTSAALADEEAEYDSPEAVYEEPAYEEPVYEEPAYEEPVYEEPIVEEPAPQEPAYEEPAADQPAETPAPAEEEPAPTAAPAPTSAPAVTPAPAQEEDEIEEEPVEDEEYVLEGDPYADVESLAYMESTIPFASLTGDWSEDLILVARSQLGYTESCYNYVRNAEGKFKGYTRYGSWFGDVYGDWCAMFASFCLYYAGVPASEFPQPGGCPQWVEALKASGQWENAGYEDVTRGDIIFFDKNYNDISDHVGIVCDVYETDGAWWIDVIEGNSANMVRIVTYPWGDSRILGYGVLPMEHTDTWTEAVLRADVSDSEPLEDDGVEILAKGYLPGGGAVVAVPSDIVPRGLHVIAAYDICLLDQFGEPYELRDGQTVTLRLRNEATRAAIAAGTRPDLYQLEDETRGAVKQDPAAVTLLEEDGALVFETDHLTVFVVGRATLNLPVYSYVLPADETPEPTEAPTEPGTNAGPALLPF